MEDFENFEDTENCVNIEEQLLAWIKYDDTEALNKFYSNIRKWYERLNFEQLFPELEKCDNGNSLYLIGTLYFDGKYVNKNYQKAFEYYQNSAEKIIHSH